MKYALIGCGRIAVNHIKAALNNKLEIVAVCDILPEKITAILTQYGLQDNASIKRYTDYNKMLDECAPELVSIATESGVHAQIALDCIDKGVHVIIEKPMAMNMVDADEIIAAVKKKASRWPPATKTASTSRSRKRGPHWRRAVSESSLTGQSMCDGTAIKVITIRLRGAGNGPPTAAR